MSFCASLEGTNGPSAPPSDPFVDGSPFRSVHAEASQSVKRRVGVCVENLLKHTCFQVHQVLNQILHQLILLDHVALEREHFPDDTLILLGQAVDMTVHRILISSERLHLRFEFSVALGGFICCFRGPSDCWS